MPRRSAHTRGDLIVRHGQVSGAWHWPDFCCTIGQLFFRSFAPQHRNFRWLLNLGGLMTTQLMLVLWTACRTSNDLFTGTENLLSYVPHPRRQCRRFTSRWRQRADCDLAATLSRVLKRAHLLMLPAKSLHREGSMRRTPV